MDLPDPSNLLTAAINFVFIVVIAFALEALIRLQFLLVIDLQGNLSSLPASFSNALSDLPRPTSEIAIATNFEYAKFCAS